MGWLTEEVGEADLKALQLGQLLQQVARDDMAAPALGRQLDHLLEPACAQSLTTGCQQETMQRLRTLAERTIPWWQGHRPGSLSP